MEQRNTISHPDVTGPITDCISVSNVTNSQQNTSIARISSSHSRSGGASPQMNDVNSSDERCRLDWREKTLDVTKVAVIILQYNILPRTQNTSAFLLFCDRGSFPSNYWQSWLCPWPPSMITMIIDNELQQNDICHLLNSSPFLRNFVWITVRRQKQKP